MRNPALALFALVPAVVALLLFVAPAQAQYSTVRTLQYSTTPAPAAPSAASTGCIGGVQSQRGFQLDSIKRYQLTIQTVGGGSSFAGSGNVIAYYFDPSVGKWSPRWSQQLYLTGGADTENYQVDNPVPVGCVYFVVTGVAYNGTPTSILTTISGSTI